MSEGSQVNTAPRNALANACSSALQAALDTWMDDNRDAARLVQPGLLGTAVIVVERLREDFPLTEDVVATKSQIRGLGGPAVARILATYGETRRFLSEGGRTSRGSRPAGIDLALRLTRAGEHCRFGDLGETERDSVVSDLLIHVVRAIGTEFFDRQRIQLDLVNLNAPVARAIERLLSAAAERGGTVGGALAQHLVGAALELGFPDVQVGRDAYTTGDRQTGRAADSTVNDTAFHVTLRPTDALFTARCTKNLNDGFRPKVLVPRNRLQAAQQLAELAGISREDVEIVAIESWIGQLIEALAHYNSTMLRVRLRELLSVYNARVGEAEADQSLQIELPANL